MGIEPNRNQNCPSPGRVISWCVAASAALKKSTTDCQQQHIQHGIAAAWLG
jgi:hypothetical protein